jgi:hypothetical protein
MMNREQALISEIDTALRNLELLFPLAGDKLDQLTALYTVTYMLKLRAMT